MHLSRPVSPHFGVMSSYQRKAFFDNGLPQYLDSTTLIKLMDFVGSEARKHYSYDDPYEKESIQLEAALVENTGNATPNPFGPKKANGNDRKRSVAKALAAIFMAKDAKISDKGFQALIAKFQAATSDTETL